MHLASTRYSRYGHVCHEMDNEMLSRGKRGGNDAKIPREVWVNWKATGKPDLKIATSLFCHSLFIFAILSLYPFTFLTSSDIMSDSNLKRYIP